MRNLFIKNVTISKTAVLLLSLVLICVIGASDVFTANALHAGRDNGEHSTCIFSTGKDGQTEVSLDNGETWINGDDYLKDIPLMDFEYYSYEEYKEWIEQQKKEFPKMLDGKFWNKTDGWFIWTQEHTDEALKLYEDLLEKIKNGMLLSKPLVVDGDDSSCIVSMNGHSISEKQDNYGTSYGSYLSLENGEVIEFGPCDSAEALAEEVKQYCEEQVANGSLTIEEANKILEDHGLSIEIEDVKTA